MRRAARFRFCRTLLAVLWSMSAACGIGDDLTLYAVSGTVSGLSGTMVLENNGDDDLLVAANGPFTFANRLPNGSSFEVIVLTQPAAQTCTISGDSGTISKANVTGVAVTCTAGNQRQIETAPQGSGPQSARFSTETSYAPRSSLSR